MTDDELDLRPLGEPDRRAAVLRAFEALAVGESCVLLDDRDPGYLRAALDLDHPGDCAWHQPERTPDGYRTRISKLASTPLPRLLGDAAAVLDECGPEAAGAVWKLRMTRRDLDSNIIRLRPGTGIDPHTGPDLDVLLLVLRGSGQITTELGTVDLHPGALVWLPRRSRRGFTAGPEGLSYLSVHTRRPPRLLDPPPPSREGGG